MGEEALPAHLSGEVPQEPVFYHNWLYSVVPGNYYSFHEHKEKENAPILTGYCRNCNQYFTKVLEVNSYDIYVAPANVPKEGCVGPSI